MRMLVWTLSILALAGFGLWGVWPVLAGGLGAAGLSAGHPSGLWVMGVQTALAFGAGASLAALACIAQEREGAQAGSAACVRVLSGCLAFAFVLLLLLAGQPLRWWFLLVENAGNGSPLSLGLESMLLFFPGYAVLVLRSSRSGCGWRWLDMVAAIAIASALCVLLYTILPLQAGVLGLAAGMGILIWLPRPGSRVRMHRAALVHGVVCILFFTCLWLQSQPWESLTSPAQWAGISLALAAAFGSVTLGRQLLSGVKRG